MFVALFTLEVSPGLSERVPFLRLGALLFAGVNGGPAPAELTALMEATAASTAHGMTTEEISGLQAVAGWRKTMKALGHDPTRYRVSSERLLRRVLKGEPLPSVNTLVDVNNVWSVATALPAGLYDADKLAGKQLSFGLGEAGEPYLTLAGSDLGVESKPVLRDGAGPCGSPLTDSARTMTDEQTRRCLFIIYAPPMYDLEELQRHMDLASDWMVRYAGGQLQDRAIIEA